MSKGRVGLFWLVCLFVGRAATGTADHGIETDVPMESHRGLPIIDVFVNGLGPFRFGVDTGAMDPIVLSESLVDSLGSAGADTTVTGSDGHLFRDRGRLVGSVGIGDATFPGSPARSHDFGPMALPVDGILGFPFFRDHLLTLDYPAGRLRINSAAPPAVDGAAILPFETHPTGLATLEMTVDGEPLTALLDTGNMAAAFYLPGSLVSRLERVAGSGGSRQARTAGGEISLEETRLAGEIHLGPMVFERPVVVFGETFSLGNVGGLAFADCAVSIDQARGHLRIVR